MPSLSFVTVDVFTTTRFAGNPLAIVNVPKGQPVSDGQMQIIAREFNLSETVFLHERSTDEAQGPEWRVRIFLTDAEVPFAGHPTIGTACYALGTVANNTDYGRLVCNAGPIDMTYRNDLAQAAIPHNLHVHTDHKYSVEQLYQLQPGLKHLLQPKALDVVSPVNGMTFICAELPSLEVLGQVSVTGVKTNAELDQGWDIGFTGSYFYVVTKHEGGKLDIRSRMIEGNFEDPATGSAACALSAFLTMKHRLKSASFTITQGVEMGRQSDIGVAVILKENLDTVDSIELSGSSVKVMEGTIQYD